MLRGSALRGHRVVVGGLPFGEHQQDNVVLGRDGRLYLGSGSTCDVCVEKNPRSATVLSLRPDGTRPENRRPGTAQPVRARLPAGDEPALRVRSTARTTSARPRSPEPAESIVLVRAGAFYGWPRCWPSYRKRVLAGRCRGVTPPIAYLEPHSSADGIAFWRGDLSSRSGAST